MIRFCFCFLISQCFVVASVAQEANDSSTPTNNYDIKHIALDLRFDWEKTQAYGSVAILFSVVKPCDRISLDSGELSIDSVTGSSGEKLDFSLSAPDGEGNLEINLGRFFEAGQEQTINISYRTSHVNKADPQNIWGSFGKGLRFQQPTSTTPKKRSQIWSSGEPDGNRYWFPCNNALNDLRTTSIRATVRQPFTVISNGELLSVKSNSDATRTFHYEAKSPHQNHLTSIVVGEYEPVRQSWDGIELTTFGYGDEKEAVEATVERLPGMIEFLSDQTGIRYAYSRYSQVVVQDYPFPGRTGQHMVPIMSDNMIDDFRTHADFLYLWDSVEAQALASQWFGNLIPIRNWRHLWLSQGFSRYFDGRFNVQANGHDEFLSYQVANDMGSVLAVWNSGDQRSLVPDEIEDLDQFTYDSYARQRGALVLRMLEHELGEEVWLQVVRRYMKSNKEKLVTTDDLQLAIEQEVGDRLDWFFQQWVYGMGHPVFEISRQYLAADKKLQLTVRQVQQDPVSPKFFQGKIDIAIDGQIMNVRLDPQAINTFEFELGKPPALVNFDHHDVWIKEVTFEKPLAELLHQLQHDTDVSGQSFAMKQLATIAAKQDCTDSTKSQILNALRNLIGGNAYWRIRMGAVSQLGNLLRAENGNAPIIFDDETKAVLLDASRDDAAWLRTAAIRVLGDARDKQLAERYLEALKDESDRVINAAAIALGKSKDPRAFDALVKLKDKPSWKSQSLISTLNGLKELGDPRGYEVALEALTNKELPRWWLAVPTWDYPIPAVHTIVELGKADTVFPMLLERFKQSLVDNDYNDIFANVLLIAELGDPRGEQVFELLRKQFADDPNAIEAVDQFESRFKKSMAKNVNTKEVSQ